MSRGYLIKVAFEDKGHGGDTWFEYVLIYAHSAKDAIDLAKIHLPNGEDYINQTHVAE
jgi:hypothetical protein